MPNSPQEQARNELRAALRALAHGGHAGRLRERVNEGESVPPRTCEWTGTFTVTPDGPFQPMVWADQSVGFILSDNNYIWLYERYGPLPRGDQRGVRLVHTDADGVLALEAGENPLHVHPSPTRSALA